MPEDRLVHVLINPESGPRNESLEVQQAIQQYWDTRRIDVIYQFTKNKNDSRDKVLKAAEQGADTILVAGGDGMLNSLIDVSLDCKIALGVIPTGSGNGFARHFNIPLDLADAARVLRNADQMQIDVGFANGRPFVVTCSLASETSVVEKFESLPIRGILPYVLSATYSAFEYEPQAVQITLDQETLAFEEPMVLTIANLSQFGGGAVIAPNASPSDGKVELVVVERCNLPGLLLNLPKLFAGEINELPEVHCRSCHSMKLLRNKTSPIQIDGELIDADQEVAIEVQQKALTVLVPKVGVVV